MALNDEEDGEEGDKISQEMDGLLNGFPDTSPENKKLNQELYSRPQNPNNFLAESFNSLAFSIDDSSCSEIARLDSLNSLNSNKSSSVFQGPIAKFTNKCQLSSLEIATSTFDSDCTFNLPCAQQIPLTPQASNLNKNEEVDPCLLPQEKSPNNNQIKITKECIQGRNGIIDFDFDEEENEDIFFLDVPKVESKLQRHITKKTRYGISPQTFAFINDESSTTTEKESRNLNDKQDSNNENQLAADISLKSEIPSRDLVTPPIQVETGGRDGKSMFSPPLLIMHAFVEEDDSSTEEHDTLFVKDNCS